MSVSKVSNMQQGSEYVESHRYKTVPLLIVLTLFLSACTQIKTISTPDGPVTTNGSGPMIPVELPVNEPRDSQTKPLNLLLCKTDISNSPLAERKRVQRESAIACLNGVPVQIDTAPGACLTSGYGPRRGKLHKGLDYQSKPAGPVVAAADGKIVVSKFRQGDFGNWIVIDHGAGVYTGYGHLASVDRAIRKDALVVAGQELGIMGKTGDATRSIHLHYEVRRVNTGSFRNFFLLEAVDPFSLPGSCPPAGQLATG